MSTQVRLELPKEADERLEQIARELGISRIDLMRRALGLLDISHEARKKGKIVGIMTKDHRLEEEFVGI
jgi:hypothetical protein